MTRFFMQITRLWLANSSARHSNKTNSAYRETHREREKERETERGRTRRREREGERERTTRLLGGFWWIEYRMKSCAPSTDRQSPWSRAPAELPDSGSALPPGEYRKKSRLGAPRWPELSYRTWCTVACTRQPRCMATPGYDEAQLSAGRCGALRRLFFLYSIAVPKPRKYWDSGNVQSNNFFLKSSFLAEMQRRVLL